VRVLPLALALALALALPAAARAESYTPVRGYDGPGPPAYDRSYVLKIGPSSARRVLVLVPGTGLGAGGFRPLANDIVRRVPGLQVWAWDRRSQGLEDTSVFATGDPDRAFSYYLNGQAVDGRTFAPVDGARDAAFAREWGLQASLEDLRRVVRAASAGGRRKVILGGHSLGGATAMAYAIWDFRGRPGYADIDGLVLIDGALDEGDMRLTVADARDQKQAIDNGDPFSDSLGLGLPWAAGVFAEIGAQYVRTAPDAPSVLQDYPLLPDIFKPPVRVTNAGLAGYVFDETTAAPGMGLEVRIGRLADTGDPRGWIDGENGSVRRLAQTFGIEPANGFEWYFPRRLTLDLQAASALEQTPATRYLGLRVRHTRGVNVPLFAFGTDATNGRAIAAARRFARVTRIPRAQFAQAQRFTHLDPLTAAPLQNHFLATVVPFLQRIR
jgi:pimeloyl-ACP methyl ester carboxylesterase